MGARTPSKTRIAVGKVRKEPSRAGRSSKRKSVEPQNSLGALEDSPAIDLEARYRALLLSSPDAILIASEKAILECNPAARDLFEPSGKPIVGKPLQLYLRSSEAGDSDSRHAVSGRIASAFRGRPQAFECHCRRVDGTAFQADIHLTGFGAAGRRMLCAVIRDVTERRRTEETLRDSETRFRELFTHMQGAVAVYEARDGGRDFVFVDFNRSGERIDNIKKEDILGRSVQEAFPGVKEFGLFDVLQRVWKTGQPERHPVSLYKDGRIAGWRENYVYKLPTGEIVSVYDDVTEHMQAMEALRESEENFKALAENANDGIFIGDADGSHLYVNQRAAEITGYSVPELLGLTMSDLVHPEHVEELRERLRNRLRGERVAAQYETVVVHRSGEPVFVEVSSARSIWEGRPVSIVIVRDVTERRRLEDELRQTQKMEAIARLAAGIAHDFNNLLTAIRGYGGMVLHGLPAGDRLRKDVTEILKASERGADLTRRLLAFGHPQAVEVGLLNLNQVLDDIGSMLAPILGKGIDLILEKAPGLDHVRADPGHIEQVIVNLSVNARDAMPDGGRLRIQTANVDLDPTSAEQYTGVRPGPYVMLNVCDTGVGMEEDIRMRALEPYFTTKRKDRGGGLGLSIVYGIVREYRGHIQIHSELGQGTCVEVLLPRADP